MTKSGNNGQALRIVKQIQLVTEHARLKQVINGFTIPRNDLLRINRMTAQCNAMSNPLVCNLRRINTDVAHNNMVAQVVSTLYISQTRPAGKRCLLIKRDTPIKVLIDELDRFSASAHLSPNIRGVIAVRNENLVGIYPGSTEIAFPTRPQPRSV